MSTEGKIDEFLIRAYNKDTPDILCYSPFSDMFSITPWSNWPVNAPGNLTAVHTAENEVTLEWVDRSAGETGFRIQRKLISALDWTGATEIDITPGNVEECKDTPPVKEEYEYRIRATLPSSLGNWWPGYSDWSNTVPVSTKDDDKPLVTISSVSSPSTTEILLNWTCNLPLSLIDGFSIEGDAGSGWKTIENVTGDVT